MASAMPKPNTQNRKERLRKSLGDSPFQLTKVAEETGISTQKLYSFASRGYLNPQDVELLAKWLGERGYFYEDRAAEDSLPYGKSIRAILASDLRNIADLAESTVDDDVVAQRLLDFVNKHAQSYEAEMKRKK